MNHLTSKQITEWMIGDRGSAEEQHVRECAQCAAAVGRMQSTLVQFGDAYRDWGGRLQMGSRLAPRRSVWLRAAFVSAMLALVFIAIPAGEMIKQNRERAAQTAIEDDALLTQIQTDLYRSVPPSLKPLEELGNSR